MRILLLLLVSLLVGQQPQPVLVVSHKARAVAPGEVVLVDVTSRSALKSVGAKWLEQTVTFYQLQPEHWQGVLPIDVAVRAGRQVLHLEAIAADGRPQRQEYPLVIGAKIFPARRITVDPKFANPPADELPRIEKERLTVEAILDRPTPERLWKGEFVAPVPGAATSSFGRRSIINGEARGQHTGTDFQAASGTPVVAPNRGRVVLAANHYYAGGTILIDHGLGLYSYLAHLSSFAVAEGDLVERGQKIALSGATGRVTGPHLHWTMRIGRARVDPLSLVAVLSR